MLKHQKNCLDCMTEGCKYYADDPRNLSQHKKQHLLPKFTCIYCYKKFCYYEQKKCHQPDCDLNPNKKSDT